MGDLISRKNVIDVIRETVAEGTMANALELRINDLPSAEPKFVEVTIDMDDDFLQEKIESYKEAIYVNRQTMIVYVPLWSVALITDVGGTIKRKGKEDG